MALSSAARWAGLTAEERRAATAPAIAARKANAARRRAVRAAAREAA